MLYIPDDAAHCLEVCGLWGLHVTSYHIDWECEVKSCVAKEMQLSNAFLIKLRCCSREIHINDELDAKVHWYMVAQVTGFHVTVSNKALGIGSLMDEYTCECIG